MTPTTAEQMPQPNWELVLQCVQIKANACISPELASLYTEQHAALTSWLAQGGARGGEAAAYRLAAWWVSGPNYNGTVFASADLDAELEAIIAAYGDERDDYTATEMFVRTVNVDLGFGSPADRAAALAPRAEAGEAVQQTRGPESSDPYMAGKTVTNTSTAACGVSGLVTDAMETAALAVYRDRALNNRWMREAIEAALKADRGGVVGIASDVAKLVVAESGGYAAMLTGFNISGLPAGVYSLHATTQAALNAGALAGGEVSEELEAELRAMETWVDAYPEDIFIPLTADETKAHSVIVTQASAGMGRHMGKAMAKAAKRIRSLVVGGVGR